MGCNRDPDCMRQFSWEELVAGTDRWWSFGGWGMRIDGVEISEDPQVLLQRGDFNRVPVIIGSNMDEIPGETSQWGMTEAEYYQWLQLEFGNKYGTEFVSSLQSVYTVGSGGRYQTPWFAIQAILTHETFTCAARRNARWMSPYVDVYHYEFQQTVGIINLVVEPVGVLYLPLFLFSFSFSRSDACLSLSLSHASELVYTLHFSPLHITLDDRRTAKSTTAYWTNFASSGDPNSVLETRWPRFIAGSSEVSFFLSANSTAVNSFYPVQCDLWDTVSHIPPRDSKFADISAKYLAELVSKVPIEKKK